MTYLTSKDYFYEVAAGRVAGSTSRIILGSTTTLNNSFIPTPFVGGRPFEGFPVSALKLKIVSNNPNDSSAGTGARTVLISGLDSDYQEQTELITMNGMSTVTTTLNFLRVNSFSVVTAGSEQWNAGTITLSEDQSSKVFSDMPPNTSLAQAGKFTIPAGQTGRLIQLDVNSSKTQQGVEGVVDILGYTRPEGVTDAPWVRAFEVLFDTATSLNVVISLPIGITLTEKTDIAITYETQQETLRLNVRGSLVLETN